MTNLETKVQKCYESAPFPDNLRKAKNFDKELKRTIDWIELNLNFLSRDLTKQRPKNVLCAGCGTGEEAISLAKIYPHSKILAIDISNPSLAIAKKNAKKARVTNIVFQQQSILEDLPSLNKVFDFIYCAGVIHHLANPEKGFRILTDKLAKNGKIVIMLYNSYGLFFYKCQLALLRILAGNNINKRLLFIGVLGLDKGKGKSEVYDSYINPQVTTFSIENIKTWVEKRKLVISGIVPPLSLGLLIEYAVSGQKYFFRRKTLVSIALKIVKPFSKEFSKTDNNKLHLPIYKTIFYQMIYLVLGKGECQYLIEN